jgi:hypothetical protein
MSAAYYLKMNGKLLKFNGNLLTRTVSDAQNIFYLAGYDSGSIYLYNDSGVYMDQSINLLSKINEFGQVYYSDFVRVRDIASFNNKFYIIDNLYDAVFEFDQDWTYLQNSYSVQSEETAPEGLGFDPSNGDVYVVGRDMDLVLRYNSSFDFDTSLFNLKDINPNFSASVIQKGKHDGNWYVCDSLYDYVYAFNDSWDGSIAAYSTKTTINGSVYGSNLYGIWQDDNNNWYGSDIDSEKVLKYDQDWNFIEIFIQDTLSDTGESTISGIFAISK